ncbi:MAG: baseplate J/gp47 family protein [Streptosporangiaceae bacterium]
MSTYQSPHSSSRRTALLEQLIVALTSGGPGMTPLPIRTRAQDDPTIALLDAWATVGDVLGFYLDRIADEGYLPTAIQPGSVLALASLVGYQPVPGLAAQAYLAYTLAPDPADGAVQFSPGLLFQSVPGPGQQPQTFEAAAGLIARPSWNLLAPKSTQPLQASTTSLVVDSTTAGLSPNSVILLDVTGSAGTGATSPQVVRVATATVDYVAKVTNVTLQGAAPPPPPAASPKDPTAAIDGLLGGGLGKPTTPVPESASQLPQTAESVFSPGSDAVPRLISTLRPAVAPVLYAALDATAIGSPPVAGASVMQVKAAPFGATAPPQPVFNAKGQPAGSRDWPIGDVFTLQLSLAAPDFAALLAAALSASPGDGVLPLWLRRAARLSGASTSAPVIDVQWSVATVTEQATIDVSGGPDVTASPPPTDFGQLGLQIGENTVTLAYAQYTPATPTPPTPALQVSASFNPDNTIQLEFTDPASGASLGALTWDPSLSTALHGQVDDMQADITWSQSPVGQDTLTLSIATPLPLSLPQQKVLLLDGNYPGIIPGSSVVIDGPAGSAVTYGVPTTAESVATVATTGYGITGKVTQLTLADPWIDGTARLQSALRPLTVYAQPAALPLQAAPVTTDVSGSSIDLDGLVAGMQPGRLIAVTGTRTDLPAGSTVQAGEIAMVASVTTGGGGGDTTYSTLTLAGPLAHSYQRATIAIYGNVVAARQGATINQVLGSGQPASVPQTFALSSGPVLADPAPTGSGFESSLKVTVDGIGYAQVGRFDSTTAPRSFLAGTNASGQTTITFPAPLPAGTGNVSASYRTGDGSQGNLQAGQITQLLSRPASLSSVTNPLPASGGSGGDDQESVRAAAPAGLGGLGRVVTVDDYAGLASSIAGVGQASADFAAGTGVVVTIAGTDPVPLDPGGSLCLGVAAAIAAVADPALPAQVVPASLYLIALTADVVPDPLVGWDATVAAVQAALLAGFGYAQRNLGQDVALSDLLAAAHAAPGVLSVTITGLALIPAAASASDLSTILPALLTAPVPTVAALAAVPSQWDLAPPPGAALAYMSDAAPGTLILSEPSS